MNPSSDPEKRTSDMMKLALDHFNDSQDSEKSGEYKSARFELGMAEEYREIYWRRINFGEK